MGCASSDQNVEQEHEAKRPEAEFSVGEADVLRSAASVVTKEPQRSAEENFQRPHKLKVTVFHARGLRASDGSLRGGGQCICSIGGRPETSAITKHINKDLDPVWEEMLEIDDFVGSDTLEFLVWDRFSTDDILGCCALPGNVFMQALCSVRELKLSDRFVHKSTSALNEGSVDKGVLKVKVEVIPPRKEFRPVSVDGSRLRVVMVGASDLEPMIGKDSFDPYCMCELLGRPDTYVETRHLDKTLEPSWEEEHIIDDYQSGNSLVFTVKDRDQDDLLGRAMLDFADFDRAEGFDGDVILKCHEGHKAKLKVRVEVLLSKVPVQLMDDRQIIAEQFSQTIEDRQIVDAIDDVDVEAAKKAAEQAAAEEKATAEKKAAEEKAAAEAAKKAADEKAAAEKKAAEDKVAAEKNAAEEKAAAEAAKKAADEEAATEKKAAVDKVAAEKKGAEEKAPVSRPGSRLRVVVLSAAGLSSANSSMFGGKSDPYCVICIPGKTDSECKTRHIDKTLNPQWNEDFELHDYEPGDDLEFRVLDYNKIKSAVQLGKVTLPSESYDRAGGFEGDLTLKESKTAAVLRVKVEVLPPLLVDAPPVSLPGSRLLVLVRSAVGLRSADIKLMGRSSSDPYCKCQVVGKPDSIFQTRHIPKTLQPQWGEEHEVETFDRGDDLEFSIFDYDTASSHDFLGKATLTSREYDREGGFDGDLRLKASGEESKNDSASRPELETGIRVEFRSNDREAWQKGIVTSLQPLKVKPDGSDDNVSVSELRPLKASINVKVIVLPPDGPDGPPVSEPGSRLKVIIQNAAGLRGADLALLSSAKSDPYCICSIPGKEDSEFRTQYQKHTLDPIWNEEYEFDEYDRGDALEFVVMDYDMAKSHDLLGRVTLPSFKFDRAGGFDGEIKLKECGKGKQAMLRVQVAVLPPLVAAAPPISELGSRLLIHVLSAGGLRAGSDPYVRCEIVGKSHSMIETKKLEKTLDPVWDEELMMTGYELGDSLKFQVFNFDKNSQNDLLGRVTLASRNFDHEGGFSGLLQLKACGKNKQAHLRVKISVLPSLETEQRLMKEARELTEEQRREAQELAMMEFAELDIRERYAAEKELLRQQQEEAAREADQRAKEEARRRAEEEAYRKAHAKQIAEKEATEIIVTVEPLYARGEVLAEVNLRAGSTVYDLSNLVFTIARLPIHPRLLLQDKVLPMDEKLLHVGISNEEIVVAEMCAVLTTSKDNTAKVWDALSGRCLYTLQSHVEPVCMACSIPSLKLIATCSMDQTAKLWILQSDVGAICLFTLRGHNGTVNSIAFSPDLKMVVTASDDRTVKIWSVKTGQCKRTYEGHRDAVLAASFTPDGMNLCTQSKDSTSKMFEVDTGRCIDSRPLFEHGEAAMTSATATACDGRIIVERSDKSAKVYDGNGDAERQLQGHTEEILSVSIVDVIVPTRPSGALMASRTFRLSSPKTANKAKVLGSSSTKKLGNAGMSGLLRTVQS